MMGECFRLPFLVCLDDCMVKAVSIKLAAAADAVHYAVRGRDHWRIVEFPASLIRNPY